ncbi:pentapeptide repeat-containing protein [Dactylosporangium matsuzakiense]|uniref:Pentapeptide repeat-containing protein n=1 Tax=Dactylosporangium matsuzakiense TaxID=53360 RepID=A0A9W6KRA8_9ACTN|nr:pentapeptide repeat-containing protein [Dactylosporangium matsuzakiense]UWZ42599.1 pentapeptide repeat-containing protein [Dactylosporangium matsuzakiense]GLL06158.1 hypothetical protein GCM10017581_079060 [Dactylosporangium matsuzakiense]
MPARRKVGGLSLIALALMVAVLTCRGSTGDTAHGHRCDRPGALDLHGRTVTALDLADRPLRCANLEGAVLDGPLGSADLRGANLFRATLRDSALTEVDLRGADLGSAVLRGGTLTDVGLERARLQGADLRAVVFLRTDLSAADLRGADLSGATLTDSNLRGARLGGANVGGTSWVDAVCPDGTRSTGATCDGHLGTGTG